MAFKSQVTQNIGLSASPSTVSPTVTSGTTATIIGLSVACTAANTITASLKLTKSGGTSVFLIKDVLIAPGGAQVLIGGDHKVVLEAGDSLTAYASAASSCDVIMSYLV